MSNKKQPLQPPQPQPQMPENMQYLGHGAGLLQFKDIKGRPLAPIKRSRASKVIPGVQIVTITGNKIPFGAAISNKKTCWVAKPGLVGRQKVEDSDIGTLDGMDGLKIAMNMYPGMMLGVASKKEKTKGILMYVEVTGPDIAFAYILNPENFPPKYEWMSYCYYMDTQIGAQIIPPLAQLGVTMCQKVPLIGSTLMHFSHEDLDNIAWAKSEPQTWQGVDSNKLKKRSGGQQAPVQPPVQQPQPTQSKEQPVNTQQSAPAPMGSMAQISEAMANELKSDEKYIKDLAEKWIKGIPKEDGSKMSADEIMLSLGRVLVDARLPEVRDKIFDKVKEQM